MGANDKFGLGDGDYRYGSILSYENEVLHSVFMNKASDIEDTLVNDRFPDGMQATSSHESNSKHSEYASCESDSSIETSTSMPELVENASKVVCEPKVWIDAPIIEEYESDSDNDSVSNVQGTKKNLVLLSLILDIAVKASAGCNWRYKRNSWNRVSNYNSGSKFRKSVKDPLGRLKLEMAWVDPHRALNDKGIVDNGCSKYMTGNKAHLTNYQEFKGGSVAFGGSHGRITGKGKIKNGMLNFEDVYYVEELKHYNLFFVS
nr:ribonuclease H-like domain-containing protein [Tanacetum cinerariifolium]